MGVIPCVNAQTEQSALYSISSHKKTPKRQPLKKVIQLLARSALCVNDSFGRQRAGSDMASWF